MKHPKARRKISRAVVSAFSAEKIQRMAEKIQGILDGYFPPSREEQFLLAQVELLCHFREARSDPAKKGLSDLLDEEIVRQEQVGKQLGFNEDELFSLNRWILAQESAAGKIKELLRRAEERMAVVGKKVGRK